MDIIAIDRNSPLPLYYQLKELLLSKIQKGELKPGQQLPTEEDIQQKYEVSRTTVRQALRELELDGRINRYAGRGTFVSEPKVQEGTEAFDLEISELQEQGLQLVWKVIFAEEVPAPEWVAAKLQITPGTKTFCLKRLRIANESAIGYVISYVAEEFMDKVDLSRAEQGGTMAYLTGISLERFMAERVVEALPAERDVARILGIDPGTPVLVLNRILRSPDAKPMELFKGIYRGDRFRYHIQDLPAQV